MIWVSIILAVSVGLGLATNVLAIAFKAKNDLPTTWADVKSMAISNGISVLLLVVIVVVGAIA